MNRENVVQGGIGLGSALAVTISWSVNGSVMWACIHGLCSWLYVICYAMGWVNR